MLCTSTACILSLFFLHTYIGAKQRRKKRKNTKRKIKKKHECHRAISIKRIIRFQQFHCILEKQIVFGLSSYHS